MEQEKIDAWLKSADMFFAKGDFKGMRACAREVLSHDMDNPDGLALFAQASCYLGETEKAERTARQVLQAMPQHWRALLALSEMYVSSFSLRRAVPVLERLWQLGLHAESEPIGGEAILLRAGGMLADAYYLLGRASEAAEVCFMLSAFAASQDAKATIYGKGLFLMNYGGQDARSTARREGYNAFFGAKVSLPHTRPNGIPNRKLRIGYISPDFREHAVANFLTPFLRDYTKLEFNVFCYQRGTADDVTRRLRRFATAWRDVTEMDAREAARTIYQDRIDILVDFSGHSQGSCLPILALKPAPIQMCAIGDLQSTGLREMDYFLSDFICLPPDRVRAARAFTEKIARLPYCHLCYAPDVVHKLPPVSAEPPAVKNGYVTFGSFNNFAKVSHETLRMWRSILDEVPSARFLLKGKIASIPDGIEEAKERLAAIGIDPARVEMRPYSPDYLEQYADMDVALDTVPYNGGLTTCEALVMGVPVVSLRGSTHGSSYGATILENAGLPELVASTADEYVKKAVRIASSPEIIKEFHAGLRDVVRASRLMDGTAYMKDVEALYRDLWKTYCEGGR